MADSFRNIEDEPFPSFMLSSLSSSHATLGNVTLGSTLGVPMAASTVAKITAAQDNRMSDMQESYLEGGQLSQVNSLSSKDEREKFALSLKDDLDDADDFIAAHRYSDMLVSIHLDESGPNAKHKTSTRAPPLQMVSPTRCLAEQGNEISTGPIMFSHLGSKEFMAIKAASALPATLEEGDAMSDGAVSDGADSDRFSGSISSFLANEKLMSLGSLNSDSTDDDVDLLQDEELEMYFTKLVPPAMQRGRVEGQEIPAMALTGNQEALTCPSSTEPENNRNQYLDDQEDFQMPHVRLAATGMDSCPASDEDTEDELEGTRRLGASRTRHLLPSASRQPVGESNRPGFRPGLEGGSSDDELPPATRNGPGTSRIEFRRSAEGQVINSPVTGDGGGGGDGSSGGEDQDMGVGVSATSSLSGSAQANYDFMRGLGIVGASSARDDEDDGPSQTSGLGQSEMGDRVGPVGTGEVGSADIGPGIHRASPVNWSMSLDRQVALEAMDSTESAIAADGLLDSLYWRSGTAQGRLHDASSSSLLQGTQGSFHLSQVLPSHSVDEESAGVLGHRGGPCGYSAHLEPLDSTSEGEACVPSLEAKYFSRSFQGEDSEDGRSNSPDDLGLDFQQDANGTHSVVYQNEEGKWVTDLAYYSSFEKEIESHGKDDVADQFQKEDFVSGNNAFEKIIEDQEEFEKEHQFMQEEQMVAQNSSLGLGDTSWRLPTSNHVLLRASQVSSDFERGSQSYLRLSLGEFFQQRSEALGCLGDSVEDSVKRPSFGYVIMSPEKREPFALIRPSDFSSRGSSVHDDTLHLSDTNGTMNREDLEKTLEGDEKANNVHMSLENMEKSVEETPVAESKTGPAVSADSPHVRGTPMLSVSTIASAIADASVSSDPAQLAAMIIELSKKSKVRAKPSGAGAAEMVTPPAAERNTLLEALQMSVSAGELSALNMEKYLRKAEISGSESDLSISPFTFELLGCLANSHRRSTPLQQEESVAGTPLAGQGCALPIGNATPSARVLTGARKSSIPKAKAHASRKVASVSKTTSLRSVSQELPEAPDACGMEPSSTAQSGSMKLGTVRPQMSNPETSLAAGPSTGQQGVGSRLNSPLASVSGCQRQTSVGQGKDGMSGAVKHTPGKGAGPSHGIVEKHVCFAGQSSDTTREVKEDGVEMSPSALPCTGAEETSCTFRPSTSPLTHSSPSQASLATTDGHRVPSSPAFSGVVMGRRPSESLSPESSCSSPSLSRLTYISMTESACLPTPDKHKRNSSLALSTTIIRASPTPPVDLDLPQNPPGQVSEAAKIVESSSEPSGTRSQSECGFRNQTADSGQHKRHSEPGLQHVAQGDSGYSSNLSVQPPRSSEQAFQQWPRELYPGAFFSTNDVRYGPISSLKSQGPLLNLPPPVPAVPALLGARSLYGSQLHQYLGTEHALRTYHLGGPAVGLCTASVPSSALGQVPGSMHLGSSGLPATYLNPSLDSGLGKPYSQHDLEALGVWPAGGLPDLQAHVIVPEELKFPSACCVGIASQTTLSIFNPTERWVQVCIASSGLSIDGEKVDALPCQWLIVKNKTIIGPKSTEEQKVLFVPPRQGLYKCVLSVSSWPAFAESSAVTRAQAFAKRVVLIAIAENPSVEVDIEASGCLTFGDLTVGSVKALPLKLTNRTHATVPIRLVISANAASWRCFTFSKTPISVPAEGGVQSGTLPPLAAPSVMNHVMHASYGDNPDSFIVWVHFHALQRCVPCAGELGPADEYTARVDIELDCPGPSQVIRTVPVKARCGTARVHAPKDMQTVHFVAPQGKSDTQMLPLKNAGNIDVQLKLRSSDSEGCFSVKPEQLALRVGEEKGITVSFHAKGIRKCRETMLTILVLPSGPQYEVLLKAEVALEGTTKPSSPVKVLPLRDAAVPPILSNKQFIAWGGVTLGRAVQQKLVLRNNSPSFTQQLRLLIRGQDQDCFQLQSTFGPEERLTRHREVTMKPREDVTVHLLFAPTRVACMLAKLEIKQSGVCSSQPGIKFTIPLSGYGGTSNIILEEARKLSDSYVVTLGGVSAGRVSKVCVCVRNTGSRAAFVKATAYADLQVRKRMDASVISMSPSQFVIKERTQEVVTVLLKATPREQSLCHSSGALLATICFFCGDEVSRQQYRRLLHSKPEAGRKLLSDSSLLKDVSFNEPFLGEEQVTEVYDLPQRPNEAHLFYSSMSKVVLSVMGSVEASDSGESDFVESMRPSPRQGSESDSGFGNSDRHVSNVSLDVLPVKGPQGPPLALSVSEAALKESAEPRLSWSIQPDQLVLAAPTVNGTADTRHVKIQNCSSREMHFELSWPAHCLTVTPQHGVLEPKSHLQILISPNPSLATKTSMLPWSGQIYVQCDGQQKSIKVQIRQDLALDMSASTSSPQPLSALPPQADTPTASGSRGGDTPQHAHVEIGNRTVVFPATVSGESSEAFLEMENGGQEVRWYLSSFAPPYVKGVDSSGDVYRATYTAFRCSRVSGILGVWEKMKVPVTFLPRDRGDYAQFWDLECHPVAEPQQKSRVRFQLCGTGVKASAASAAGSQNVGDSSLVRTEATLKARKKCEASVVRPGQEETQRRGVYAPQDLYAFPLTRVGETSTLKVNMRNNSFDTHELKFISPREPFHIKHSKYSLRSQHYINLPVQFRPTVAGTSSGVLAVQTDMHASFTIRLTGEAVL